MTELQRTPLFRALYRPQMILGGERELVLLSLVLCVGLGVTSQNMVGILVSTGVWVVVIALLRLMGKADPLMSKVYLRHLQYQHYYPARSTPWRNG